MSLKRGAISKDIETEIERGKSQKQAATLNKAGKKRGTAKKK